MAKNVSNSATLRIQTLGPFQVQLQQDILIWPTQKSKALLQILLVEPGRTVPTEQILEYLWPDLPPNKAQNNLWVTVSQLRRLLQPDLLPRAHSLYIHKKKEGYRFNIESNYWLDGEEFTIYLSAAQAAPDLLSKVENWEAAQGLYQGNYLEDEPYAEWAQFPRIEWQRRYKQLLLNLANAHGQNGRYQQAIAHCQEILAIDKTNETAYRLLMRCHASLGERSTALKIYDEAAKILQSEIGIDPVPETVELVRQIQNMEGDWKLEAKNWSFPSKRTSTNLPFVGRGMQINQFSQLLSKSAIGQGQLALISGEPGIGKSRLIKEATVLISQHEFSTIVAHCYQVEQSMPYQPVIDLIRQLMLIDNRWQQLPPVWLRELSVLIPETESMINRATNASPTEEPDKNQQGRLFQAIYHLFANQTKYQKLLLVIEDIHWADPSTLQFIHYLSRHLAQVPVVLLLSLQDQLLGSDADLTALLNSLKSKENATLFSLEPLTEEDILELLRQSMITVSSFDSLGKWLFQETNGNPFFFVSLLQSIQEEGLIANEKRTDWATLTQKDKSITLPDAIRNSVRNRLQRLSETELEVLSWISVYGRGLDFPTLQTISQQPKITLLNTLEQLLSKQLLVESAGQYSFNHNKISEVLYFDLSSARRILYHQKIAETLDDSSPSLDQTALLGHHFERSGENEKALKNWMQAGEYALNTYAYQQAIHHYERALALADITIDKIDAYLGLVNAFILLDDHIAAKAVIQQGLELVEHRYDETRHMQLLFAQAQNANRQHRPDGGKPEVEIALVTAEQAGNKHYLAQSLLLLTEVHESNGDLNSALETAIRAQKVCNELKNPALEARALIEIGFLHAQQASFDKAVNVTEMGLELLFQADDRNATAYAWNILGRALGGRGDYGKALEAFQRSQKEAEIVGDRYLQAQVFNMKGWIYRELGDHQAALELDMEGVKFAKKWSKPSPEISARLNVCLDLLHLGDSKLVPEKLDEIELQVNSGSFGFHSWRWKLRLLHIRGLSHLLLKQPEKVLPIVHDGLSLAKKNITRKYIALNYELRGMALAELGKIDEAIEAMENSISIADEIHYQPIRWSGRQQLAKLFTKRGNEKEAKSTVSEAKEIIQTISYNLEDQRLQTIFLKFTLPE